MTLRGSGLLFFMFIRPQPPVWELNEGGGVRDGDRPPGPRGRGQGNCGPGRNARATVNPGGKQLGPDYDMFSTYGSSSKLSTGLLDCLREL